jgi:branched-chain amino acid transport system substrate-binding protein
MGRFVIIWLCILTLGVVFAPAVLGATEGGIPEGEGVGASSTVQKGIELYRSGKSEEALSLLRGFVVSHSDSPELPQAYLYLARIFRDRGRDEEALLYLDRIPPERRGPEVLLIKGASLVAIGKTAEGMTILGGLEGQSLSGADRAILYTALADGKLRQGLPLQALFFLHQGASSADSGTGGEYLQKAHEILRSGLSDADLAEAAFMFDSSPIGEDAILQQALRAFSAGQKDQARKLAERLVQSPASFPYRREAVQLMEKITGKAWLQSAIGVVLPLTGRYATFGELVRRGMELALQVHGEGEGPRVGLIFRDAGADPEKAVATVTELAEEEGVMAIAGPLTGVASLAAAGKAQEERVPLLTLSQREGLPEIGDYVFRDSLTASQQVKSLVNYAMGDRKMTTFAILYPENKLGREMTELFTREVGSRGGHIAATQSYAENDTDFGRQIKLLKGENPDAPEPPSPPPGTTGTVKVKPALGFDALFIPDYADRVGLIAPQLAFYGIEDFPLLGINGWNSPELIRLAGRYVEGAVFVDGFFRYSPYSFVKDFVNLYYEKYGEEPTILEAQGFDVAGILLSLLDSPDIRTREDLRQSLARLRDYPGVTGATSFDSAGDVEKVLFLLKVENGNIVQIN